MTMILQRFANKIDLTADFRLLANLIYACAAIALLTPFTINNFIHGRAYIGFAWLAVAIVLIVNAISILRGQYYPVRLFIFLVPALIGTLCLVLLNQDIIGVMWCYPAILSFYIMFPERLAWIGRPRTWG